MSAGNRPELMISSSPLSLVQPSPLLASDWSRAGGGAGEDDDRPNWQEGPLHGVRHDAVTESEWSWFLELLGCCGW